MSEWVQILVVALLVGIALGYLGTRAIALWRGRSGSCGQKCAAKALHEAKQAARAGSTQDTPPSE